jgi:hypothetical protein
MNGCIKQLPWLKSWLKSHPKLQQWLWFVGLWLSGLLAITALAYPIKLLIKSMA